jgi:hypothetical protein
MKKQLTQRDHEQLQILEYIATNTPQGLSKRELQSLRAYGEHGDAITKLNKERHP